MESFRREGLQFLAPGILHRLGNSLFAVQGHAQMLGAEGAEGRVRSSILKAVDRGNRSLDVMRGLLGDRDAEPQDATPLLVLLTELLGVPLRERGHTIETRIPDDETFRGVDGGSFGSAVVEAVRLLVTVLPRGHVGILRLVLRDEAPGNHVVEVSFAPQEGSLPFPVATTEIHAGLERALCTLRRAPDLIEVDAGVGLVFGRPGVTEREAQA